jgi:AhpD family alkylhydroperoxidase
MARVAFGVPMLTRAASFTAFTLLKTFFFGAIAYLSGSYVFALCSLALGINRICLFDNNYSGAVEDDHADFELWSLVVSAINGCGKCVSSHETVLLEKGVGEEQIIAGVRIAAVVHGTAVALDAMAG